MLHYRVHVTEDADTGAVVTEVRALGIADQGADVPEALANIKAMVAFHVGCLQEEGEPIPRSEEGEEGIYVHVRMPARAA
jgi:predicted RNase H-like HicB family nuclease